MKYLRLIVISMLFGAAAHAQEIEIGGRLEQGGLVVGTAPPGSNIVVGDRSVPVAPDGSFLVGIDRDAPSVLTFDVIAPDGKKATRMVEVAARTWKIDRVDGVPQNLVTPDPETAARIAADSKVLAEVRSRVALEPFYKTGFVRPAEGRISGVFGSQRILNGSPRAFHAGLDIAAPSGTPIKAAADGVVSLADPDMVLSGQTVMINHGYGLQTSYIHMSRIDVQDGQAVKRGDVIGTIGMTGRATGPHLHFSVMWFNTRLDPETVLDAMPAAD